MSFAKVAEFQRRGVVHFHGLIRVDGPDGFSGPPMVLVDAGQLADAVGDAAALVRLAVSLPAASCRRSAATSAVQPTGKACRPDHYLLERVPDPVVLRRIST